MNAEALTTPPMPGDAAALIADMGARARVAAKQLALAATGPLCKDSSTGAAAAPPRSSLRRPASVGRAETCETWSAPAGTVPAGPCAASFPTGAFGS